MILRIFIFDFANIYFSFVKYLENKKTFYIIESKQYLTTFMCMQNIIFTSWHSNSKLITINKIFDFLHVLYKYNGRICYYYDSCFCNKLPLANNCIEIKKFNFNIYDNDNDVCIDSLIQYMYINLKNYDYSCISKINFDIFTNLLNIYYCNNCKNNRYVYTIIFVVSSLYCIKYQNKNILRKLVDYIITQIEKNATDYMFFTIISFLSSYTKWHICNSKNINNCECWDMKIINNINRDEFKILNTEPYFNIIEKIITNDIFYTNIKDYEYYIIKNILTIKINQK